MADVFLGVVVVAGAIALVKVATAVAIVIVADVAAAAEAEAGRSTGSRGHMRSLMPSVSALRAVQHIALLAATGQFSIQPRTQGLGVQRIQNYETWGVQGPRGDTKFGVQAV